LNHIIRDLAVNDHTAKTPGRSFGGKNESFGKYGRSAACTSFWGVDLPSSGLEQQVS
jgi:hypothetical protein